MGPSDDADHASPPPEDWRSGMKQAAPLLGLGMQMALTMALFVAAGFWVDRKFETSPAFTLAGAVLAIVALGLHLARIVRSLNGPGGKDPDT